MRLLRRCLVAFALLAGAVLVVQPAAPTSHAAACSAGNLSAAQLTAVFANPGVGGGAGYAGGDYQHVYPLPDGRNLWLFQDVFFSADNDLRDSLTAAAHNAGLVQNGNCWSIVGGPQMHNFIGSAQTTPLVHWFWPLDGAMGADGTLWIFMAEMYNPNKNGATWGAAPIGTWVARVDPSTLAVLSFTKAPDSGGRLYGWSVTDDSGYSYLYGHCYRQYTHVASSVAQFDSTCMPSTYLARVPKGHFEAKPEYWTGSAGWSADPAAARPLMTRGYANPMDVQRFGDVYVNVTKIDDWWGAYVYVDKAPNPWGPWETDQIVSVVNDRRCSQCGNYHAQLLPYLDANGKMVLSLSNGGPFNLWQANAYLYRPSFMTLPLPNYRVDAAASGLGVVARSPLRAMDTRKVNRRVKGGTFLVVPLAGVVAPGAVGVVANLTAVSPSAVGYLTAWSCGARLPTTSVLNYRAGATTANAVHVRLDGAQQLCVFSWADADVLVDVSGSYVPVGGAGLHPTPVTRVATTIGGTQLAAGATLTVPVGGTAGVPSSGVDLATLTVTASSVSAKGFLTVWPCGEALPTVSSLNMEAGDTVANSVTVPLASNGTVCVYSSVATHVTVDVVAWWNGSGLRARIDLALRPLDTRSSPRPTAGSVTVVPLSAVTPVGTTAVIGNLTAVGPSAAGSLSVTDCTATPDDPTLQYAAFESRAGLGLVPLSADRTLCLRTTAAANLLVDLMVTF